MFDLELVPVLSFPDDDEAISGQVLASIGYEPAACGEDVSRSTRCFRGPESNHIVHEADRIKDVLIPQLHCGFTITLRAPDGRFETRWANMVRR